MHVQDDTMTKYVMEEKKSSENVSHRKDDLPVHSVTVVNVNPTTTEEESEKSQQQQPQKQQHPSNMVVFEGLQPMDVICAQNRKAHRHVGNVRYQEIIAKHQEEYLNARRKDDKSNVTRSVIQQVRDAGSRFMKYHKPTKTWVEIDPIAVHEKVSHALRNINHAHARRQRNHVKSSSRGSSMASSSIRGGAHHRVRSSLSSSKASALSTTSSSTTIPSSSCLPPLSHQNSGSISSSFFSQFRGGELGTIPTTLNALTPLRSGTNEQSIPSLSEAGAATEAVSSPSLEPIPFERGPVISGNNQSSTEVTTSNKRGDEDLLQPLSHLRSVSGGVLQEFAKSWSVLSSAPQQSHSQHVTSNSVAAMGAPLPPLARSSEQTFFPSASSGPTPPYAPQPPLVTTTMPPPGEYPREIPAAGRNDDSSMIQGKRRRNSSHLNVLRSLSEGIMDDFINAWVNGTNSDSSVDVRPFSPPSEPPQPQISLSQQQGASRKTYLNPQHQEERVLPQQQQQRTNDNNMSVDDLGRTFSQLSHLDFHHKTTTEENGMKTTIGGTFQSLHDSRRSDFGRQGSQELKKKKFLQQDKLFSSLGSAEGENVMGRGSSSSLKMAQNPSPSDSSRDVATSRRNNQADTTTQEDYGMGPPSSSSSSSRQEQQMALFQKVVDRFPSLTTIEVVAGLMKNCQQKQERQKSILLRSKDSLGLFGTSNTNIDDLERNFSGFSGIDLSEFSATNILKDSSQNRPNQPSDTRSTSESATGSSDDKMSSTSGSKEQRETTTSTIPKAEQSKPESYREGQQSTTSSKKSQMWSSFASLSTISTRQRSNASSTEAKGGEVKPRRATTGSSSSSVEELERTFSAMSSIDCFDSSKVKDLKLSETSGPLLLPEQYHHPPNGKPTTITTAATTSRRFSGLKSMEGDFLETWLEETDRSKMDPEHDSSHAPSSGLTTHNNPMDDPMFQSFEFRSKEPLL